MEIKTEFFNALKNCTKGERAALRRCCGKMLKEAEGDAILIFYRCLPYGVPAWQEDQYFAAGCFSCLWDGDEQSKPAETIVSQMKDASGSMEHRLAALLDTRWDADGFLLGKLSRMVKMAKAKGMAVDCEKLLADLLNWNSGTQTVQRKWAKALYTENDI